jgi:hypothetical protein
LARPFGQRRSAAWRRARRKSRALRKDSAKVDSKSLLPRSAPICARTAGIVLPSEQGLNMATIRRHRDNGA